MNLYNLKPDAEERLTPEAVFFHELGHVLQVAFERKQEGQTNKILSLLQELGLPLSKHTYEQKLEFLSDTFGTGMMYDSPFSGLDPFIKIIPNEYKEVYNKLVEKLILDL